MLFVVGACAYRLVVSKHRGAWALCWPIVVGTALIPEPQLTSCTHAVSPSPSSQLCLQPPIAYCQPSWRLVSAMSHAATHPLLTPASVRLHSSPCPFCHTAVSATAFAQTSLVWPSSSRACSGCGGLSSANCRASAMHQPCNQSNFNPIHCHSLRETLFSSR